ncbi:MAG: DNA polymerase III subunit gamma/tau [bacterium]
MTFIGSARKWRPQRFEDLIGQEHIRRTLTNALAAGRIAPAYLFSGTRGVGKTTTARILAKALNCESAEDPVAEPCNKCSSCEEVNRSAHPDVLEIDGATYTGVDHVRDLREGLRYRPARGRYKTVIIDEVHMLSRGAFNALLKTLEEPPPHVVFIFATTEHQKVPDTILSRCQVFEFRRIAPGVIAEQLSRIVKEQKCEVEEDALRLLARMGEGSMRDAQSLLDQVIAFSGDETVSAREVEGVLGVPSSEVYRNIVSAVIARDARTALCELNGIFDAGHDLRFFCGNLLEFLRDLMVLQAAGEEEGLFNLGPGEMEERKSLARKLSFHEAHQAYSFLQTAEYELRSSSHPRMTLELAVLRMCQMESMADLGSLIEKLESAGSSRSAGEANLTSRSAPSARPAGPAGDSPPASQGPAGAKLSAAPEERSGATVSSPVVETVQASWNPEEVDQVWKEAVKSLRPSQQELLKEAGVDLATEGRIGIRLPAGNGNGQARDVLQQALPVLQEFFGANAPLSADVVLEESGEDSPPAAPPVDAATKEHRKRKKEKEEAYIQEVIDIFNGQISAIRPFRTKSGPTYGDL